MESINKFKITLGANVSNSPFCNLHNTCCVRLPAIPKLRLCIWQKWRSHIWLLTRSWINVSPTHNTSGSASLASAQNRLCWNRKIHMYKKSCQVLPRYASMWARKFKKVQAKNTRRINFTIFFGPIYILCNFKNDQKSFFELGKSF